MYEHEETATDARDEEYGGKCAGPSAFLEHRFVTLRPDGRFRCAALERARERRGRAHSEEDRLA